MINLLALIAAMWSIVMGIFCIKNYSWWNQLLPIVGAIFCFAVAVINVYLVLISL